MLSFFVFVSSHRRLGNLSLPHSDFRLGSTQPHRKMSAFRADRLTKPHPITFPVNPLESTLLQILVSVDSKDFRAEAKSFRMRTYEKPQGGGGVIVNQVTVNQPGLAQRRYQAMISFQLERRTQNNGTPRVNYV